MKPTRKHIAGIIFALFILAACPRIALAADNAPPFMQVGKMYQTYIGKLDPEAAFKFIVLDLGKDGWVKIQRIDSERGEATPEQNRFKIWFNTKAVTFIIELEEPKKEEPKKN